MSENFTSVDREFSWDDTIQNEGSEFTLLPEGCYRFTVEKFERGRSSGKGKIPACNMALLTLRVSAAVGSQSAIIEDSLLLHTKMEWKLCQFFLAIGQKKHDEPLRMNWQTVPGSSGWCEVKIETWTGNDGKERQSNRIVRYIDPADAPEYNIVPDMPQSGGGFWNN